MKKEPPSLAFMRSLKIKSDDQVFDMIYDATDLNDLDFKHLIAECVLRLVGMIQK